MSSAEERKRRVLERILPVVLLGVVPVALFLVGWGLRSEARERERVIGWLNSLMGSYTVKINGQRVADPSAIVNELKRIVHVPAHHSSPTQPLLVEVVTSSESLELLIGRDSEQPMEYWVFVPDKGNRAPEELGSEIGRVTTAGFASYWGSSNK